MTTVQLFSGGLDSLCLWVLSGRPTCVYVYTGHAYELPERQAIMRLQQHTPGLHVQTMAGPLIGGLALPDGHVPHRNLNLLATAAAYTGADRLLLGALLGEASPDKSRRFLRAASAALTASEGRRVRVVAPAARWTKTGLLRRALRQEPWVSGVLHLTRSCYAAGEGECGQCQACFRRHVALYRCGLTDTPPRLPAGTTWRTAAAGLRQAGVTRWPALAVNNAGAAQALWHRRHGRAAARA